MKHRCWQVAMSADNETILPQKISRIFCFNSSQSFCTASRTFVGLIAGVSSSFVDSLPSLINCFIGASLKIENGRPHSVTSPTQRGMTIFGLRKKVSFCCFIRGVSSPADSGFRLTLPTAFHPVFRIKNSSCSGLWPLRCFSKLVELFYKKDNNEQCKFLLWFSTYINLDWTCFTTNSWRFTSNVFEILINRRTSLSIRRRLRKDLWHFLQ